MGSSSWSDADYSARQTHRASTGASAFKHHQSQERGAEKVHPQMDPKGVKFRESRDSDVHPASNAVIVLFDVTGSMIDQPVVLQSKLGQLMRVLVSKAYLPHPQLLFGAIGDALSDRVPFQIGQFESGLEMDDDLGKIVLEGNGGGQGYESYELGAYFAVRHTSCDCYEKRQKKGYLITIGDERIRDVDPASVKKVFGDTIPDTIPVKTLVAEVLEKWEWFHIVPLETSNGQNEKFQDSWKKLLGERVVLVDNANAICETISMLIGANEEMFTDVDQAADDLASAGADKSAVATASSAVAAYMAARAKAMFN